MNNKFYWHLITAAIILTGAMFISAGCREEKKAPEIKKPDIAVVKPVPVKPELKILYGIDATGDSGVVERFFEIYTELEPPKTAYGGNL
jgi:hypothetical protein